MDLLDLRREVVLIVVLIAWHSFGLEEPNVPLHVCEVAVVAREIQLNSDAFLALMDGYIADIFRVLEEHMKVDGLG